MRENICKCFAYLAELYQFSSVVHSCPTLCDPIDCSIPGFPVHHQLLELAQTHVHWVSDAIQASYLLLSPSPPASIFPSIRVFSNEKKRPFNWKRPCSFLPGSLYQLAKVLVFQLQHQSFQWMNTHGILGLTLLIFLQFKGLSKVFSNTAVQKHQFFGTQLSL